MHNYRIIFLPETIEAIKDYSREAILELDLYDYKLTGNANDLEMFLREHLPTFDEFDVYVFTDYEDYKILWSNGKLKQMSAASYGLNGRRKAVFDI